MSTVNGNWDTKIQLMIKYPSQKDGGDQKDYILTPIESINIRQSIEQTTVNTISQSHIGFSTAMGEFTGTFRIYETSANMVTIDEVKAKNRYFDIAVTEIDDAEPQQDWKVTQLLLVGCKLTGDEKSYVYGRIPIRSYNFKFLTAEDKQIGFNETDDYTITFGNGIFAVTVDERARDSTDLDGVPAEDDDDEETP